MDDEDDNMIEEIHKDKEKQDPIQLLDNLTREQLMYDCFYLGTTKYLWNCIPDPEGNMPENPQEQWNFNDYYDKPIGWRTDFENYINNVINWKKKQIKIIQEMNEQELIVWKIKYKRNVEMKKAKAQDKNLIDFHIDEIV